jgi:acyl-CoA synthetase (NDP forming)
MNAILDELRPVFYPRSIAVVGASSDEVKSGTQFLKALVKVGYAGALYPVNRSGERSCGLPAFTSLRNIPGPIDYVIVAIPRNAVLSLLDDCAAKGVKAVQFFTAGFRETNADNAVQLEREMVARARTGGFRIIGPNCIGIYNPSARIPYGPLSQIGEPGSVGFISQSGGHGGRFVELGLERRINFSKLVSFGNGADLDCVDFLEYFAADPETKVIGAYLESVSRGKRFVDLVRQISRQKPIVVWKGGRSAAGSETAASHTGALSSSYSVWKAAMAQAGAIAVESLDELADTIIGLEAIGPETGVRAAIVCGLGGGGGGESVLAADVFSGWGLEVHPFADRTRSEIGALLPGAGTILRNPLDLGGILPRPEVLERVISLVLADENVDLLIVQEHLGKLMKNLVGDELDAVNQILIASSRAKNKPLMVVAPAWARTEPALEIENYLRRQGVPVYRSFETAAGSIARVAQCFGRLKRTVTWRSQWHANS